MLFAFLQTVDDLFTSLLKSIFILSAWLFAVIVFIDLYLRVNAVIQSYCERTKTTNQFVENFSTKPCSCSFHLSQKREEETRSLPSNEQDKDKETETEQ
jgi:hypothetical protein